MITSERSLAVFIMGGTIDSRNAPEHDGEVVTLKKSLVKKYLEKGMLLNFPIIVEVICMKDSRSITKEDRIALVNAIQKAGCRYNLITHGTYTMQETAQYLYSQESLQNTVIGVTGGMGTLLGTVDEEGRLMPSDAQFNLGFGIASLFHAEYGVYQSMNGELFRLPDEWWMHSADGISWKKNGVITTHSNTD